jgi:hypothetical protein
MAIGLDETRTVVPGSDGGFRAADIAGPGIDPIDEFESEKMHMGSRATQIALDLLWRMKTHAATGRLGFCLPGDCGYQIFADNPGRLRYPDGSFVLAGRLPGDKAPNGHMTIPPDIAFEVVSPNDLFEEVDKRINDLLSAGRPLALVFVPKDASGRDSIGPIGTARGGRVAETRAPLRRGYPPGLHLPDAARTLRTPI